MFFFVPCEKFSGLFPVNYAHLHMKSITHTSNKSSAKPVNNSNRVGKGITKLLNRKKLLTKKKDRTQMDSIYLFNVAFKLENKSLSKVYKDLKNATGEFLKYRDEILGKSKFPSFNDFKAKASKKRGQYQHSIYSGLMMLKQFNKIEKTLARVKRQNANAKRVKSVA